MKFTLFLLNEKGYFVLESILKKKEFKNLIQCVVAARDSGNQEDYYEEIKDLCFSNGIKFRNKQEALSFDSDYAIAIGWKWLIKRNSGLIVLHDSYLPFYRGFSPIVNMLVNGEQYLAATAIWASEKMDEGDIIVQRKSAISYPIKIKEAIKIVSFLYREIVIEILEKFSRNEIIESKQQNEENATYSIWRDEKDYRINWEQPAEVIERFINAVGFPYGGARTISEDTGTMLKINACKVLSSIKQEIYSPGKILMFEGGCPIVLCGKNALMLTSFTTMEGKSYRFTKFRNRLK